MWRAVNSRCRGAALPGRGGFTILEMLVSMTILLLMVAVLATMLNQTGNVWSYTRNHIEQFRQARDAFEIMSRRVSQATLNTYLDYVDVNGNPRVSGTTATMNSFVPARYSRISELRFICGPNVAGNAGSQPPRPTGSIFFQAPLGFVSSTASSSYGGLENLLNTCGYFIEFNNNGTTGLNADGTGLKIKPPFVTSPDCYRFRLMEMMQPADTLSIYNYTATNPGLKTTDSNGKNWYTDSLNGTSRPVRVVAENIIALIIVPKLSPGDQTAGGYSDASLAPTYTYDTTLTGQGATDSGLNSKNQLPPVLTVTMVAVDEASYSRFQGTSTTMPGSLGLATLFQSVGDTKDATKPGFARDLNTLRTNLQNSRINYQVFTTDIVVKGAKWSRAQAN